MPTSAAQGLQTHARSTASRGQVTLIIGCMFSGKTTELIRLARAHPAQDVAVFKHWLEARYASDAVVSHARDRYPAAAVQNAREILNRGYHAKKLIGVDEAHFFSAELVEVVRALRDAGVDVALTALDRDSWGRPFTVVDRLRATAQRLVERTTFCGRCGAIADRTQRLTRIVDRSMVGGPESYEPRCLACWRPPPESPADGW